jgi:hypothetical protein
MDKTGLEFFSNERGTDFAVGDHEILKLVFKPHKEINKQST